MKNTKNTHNDVGFLLYNIPTPSLDYKKITSICVKHLKHYMPNIPVAVCGEYIEQADINIPLNDVKTNQRTYVHLNEIYREVWNNLTRDQSLSITPFLRTVLLDSDYIVQTNRLEVLFESHSPLLMYEKYFNIEQNYEETDYLGNTKIPLKWATVLCFDRSSICIEFFALWKKIIQNYNYYQKLYNWKSDKTIWNDKAVTIAHQQITNYNPSSQQYVIPWSQPLANFSCRVEHLGLDKIILKDQKSSFQVHTDVHILNKQEML